MCFPLGNNQKEQTPQHLEALDGESISNRPSNSGIEDGDGSSIKMISIKSTRKNGGKQE